ncbi:MAG: D-alanyl-D-alanine carboxypeptidase [Lachnospiraceae bacterium]|nr:D-alanyl-D-alanine carboxypeptidase [Lachnospiraceae bacterium]
MKSKILIARKKIGSSILLLLFLFYTAVWHMKDMPQVFVTVEQLEKKITLKNFTQDVPETEESAEEPSQLYAKSALLMDAVSNRVLFEKNGYEVMPMASTTKIMTCIYVLENSDLDQIVTVSANACNQPKVRLGMKEGEQYILKDLLYALMLESYNDCAVAIAEHVSGDVATFCEEMTNKAKDIGAYDTNFITPNGLDAEEHYTTAYDLALITSYAIKNPQFLEIISTANYEFYEKTKGNIKMVYNRDAFLTQYEGAIGVKTGYTSNAGYCFVGAAKQEEKQLISVVLASGWPPNKNYKWEDTKKLMNYGFAKYQMAKLNQEQIMIPDIPVKNNVISENLSLWISFEEQLLLRDDERIVYKVNLPDVLNAPVKKNQKIGSISIYLDSEYYKDIPVYSADAVEKMNYMDCFELIISKFTDSSFCF